MCARRKRKEPNTLFSFNLPLSMMEKLDDLAYEERRSKASILREILGQSLANDSSALGKTYKNLGSGMHLRQGYHYGERNAIWLTCPICGNINAHVEEGVEVEDYERKTGYWTNFGFAVEIRCESNPKHRFWACVSTHKGDCHFWIQEVAPTDY